MAWRKRPVSFTYGPVIERAGSCPGRLPRHATAQGGAGKLLHDGQKTTQEIEGDLAISNENGENRYAFRLRYAKGDTLYFEEEKYRFVPHGALPPWQWTIIEAADHSSPQLLTHAASNQTARTIRGILQKIIIYQFHDTSFTARMRGKWNINDCRWLKSDAANIAPVLLRLKNHNLQFYQRIVAALQLLLPFFEDFVLEPEANSLILGWTEHDSDIMFSADQASDGMLRAVALVTLLLQPRQDLPDVLILDEPELGLHPYAINIVGDLIRAASRIVQVIVATQSTLLIDCFEPDEIVVVERQGRTSSFKRLEAEPLTAWLREYSVSELWEKNIVGGRP